jgi:hypothetical protein
LVTAVCFVPGSSTRLISAADDAANLSGIQVEGGIHTGPELILWDLEEKSGLGVKVEEGLSDELLDQAVERGLSTMLDVLSGPAEIRYTVDPANEVHLRRSIRSALRKADTQTLVASPCKIPGRLRTSFQSEVFNHAGDRFVYLPSH